MSTLQKNSNFVNDTQLYQANW